MYRLKIEGSQITDDDLAQLMKEKWCNLSNLVEFYFEKNLITRLPNIQ